MENSQPLIDFEDEEFVRTLPKCGHFFHLVCIDKWLVQQGSCPIEVHDSDRGVLIWVHVLTMDFSA
ncbi:hypothetical protein JHK82_050709 [Glycine max]|nr:hypothetical protein JHK86_050576 [Glycine max]KAG4936498.1 hypothetical protein JHK85_051417 [Glycine max]KAG5091931.1 hypothetical protein JHK82_050709 [Glycine max]KAG5095024.1 hypothetical protein JHK84_050612 [Glycine max]